jgi:hypothetical protein
MNKSPSVASLILGASIAVAILKYYSMSKEERKAFWDHIKSTTNDLLDNAESTVEKVERFMNELKSKGENEWIEKLFVLKKMFVQLYGTEKRYLL